MNKRETEDFIIKHLNSFLAEKGFKHRKSNRTEVEYIRKINQNNFERFRLSTINYYDSHKLRFGFGKRIGSVEEILKEVDQVTPLPPPTLKKDSPSLGFSYNSYIGSNNDGCFGYMENEEQVKENVDKIIEFTENEALPFLEKLNDIREIDKRINREGENFWQTDENKPFNLAGRFVYRRVIIAKLSGKEDYEDFIEKIKKIADARATVNGNIIDWSDNSIAFVFLLKYLKNVRPHY